METKSLHYTNAIKSPKRYVKGKVELYNGSTLLYTFLPTDFLVSISIDRKGSNGKSFGYTIAQKAKVKIIDIHRAFNIQTGQTFKVYLGVETPDGIEYSNFPTFTIFEDMIKRDEETGDLEFEGFDMIGVSQRMYAADIPNIDYLAYTGPITGYLDALGQALGTTSVYTGAANLSKVYEEGAHVDTFGHEILRNVIRQAAEITGSIAFIDNSNRLCFKPLIPTSVKEISKDDYFDFKSGESQKLSMINHANTLGDTNTVGEELPGHFVQNLHNNSFIVLLEENERQVLLGNILTTASQATLRDMELEWRGDPALEIGDFITINGNFIAPIIKDSISYDGGMNQVFSYSVKGEPEDPLEPSSLPEALKVTRARVNKLDQEIALTIKRDEFTEVMGGVENRLDDVEFIMTPEQISQSIKTTVTTDLDLQALIRGEDGAPGADGADGSDGKGIVSTVVAYANHTNGTTPPTTGWQASPAPVKGKYLWTRVITTYSDGSTIPTYSVAYQATDGQAGKGISSTSVEYAQTASGTDIPTSWSGTRPAPIKGQYLWSKTTIIYTDATSSVAYSTGYTATDGQNGADGADGADGAPGAPGADGKDGEDGQPTYTWVKYADSITGTGMSDSATGKRFIGLAFNKPTITESTTPGDYEWSPLYDNVQVGGRNYLRESDALASTTDYLLKSYPLTLPIVSGETYTIQIKGQLGTGKTAFLIQNSDSYTQETTLGPDDLTSDGVYTKTFVADINGRDNVSIVVYSEPEEVTTLSEIEWIKLEKGNVATDWAPAPEDISGKLSEQDVILADLTTISQTNSSLINQTNEAITSLVTQEVYQTSLDGLKDELEGHVASELDTRITNYSSEVDQKFDSVTTTFTSIATEISDLGNELQVSLDEISTYIRFDINGIELGELGSDIKLFIENDRIVFKQNDVEVAYINNNRLYITDGQFLNSLRLGEFAFIPRSNGNLSFGKVM